MISEIRIQVKADLGLILSQDNDAIFIPNHTLDDVVHIMYLAIDGIDFTADVSYLQFINNKDGLTIFDGREAVFCQNFKLTRLIKAVIA